MKKKLVFASVFLFIGLVALGTKLVLAETGILPRVTTACESKKGGALMGIDDGFSNLKSCPGNSRKVILGAEQKSGNVKIGKIRFVSDDPNYMNIYILNDEGKVLTMSRGDTTGDWGYDSRLDLPSGVSVDDVVIWDRYMFMTVDGNVYYSDPESDNYTAWLGPFAAPIQ